MPSRSAHVANAVTKFSCVKPLPSSAPLTIVRTQRPRCAVTDDTLPLLGTGRTQNVR